MPRCIVTLVFLIAPALTFAETTVADHSEDAKKWSFQSYWQDASIEQAYRFSTNKDDQIVGAASVLVDFKVGAEKRSNRVELRMEPESRLDLSNAEAIEISLKHIDGTVLNPADLYLCNPGFQKLAVYRWPQSSETPQSDEWRRMAVMHLRPQRWTRYRQSEAGRGGRIRFERCRNALS